MRVNKCHVYVKQTIYCALKFYLKKKEKREKTNNMATNYIQYVSILGTIYIQWWTI